MMKRKRYNLTPEEKVQQRANRDQLISIKEKVYVSEPWHGYCDNTDHPLFTIKITVDKPFAPCYYCSKTWILEKTNG